MSGGERLRYRCCQHCADDPVHAVEPGGHEIPCNAPNSRGCVGRTVNLPQSRITPPTEGRSDERGRHE